MVKTRVWGEGPCRVRHPCGGARPRSGERAALRWDTPATLRRRAGGPARRACRARACPAPAGAPRSLWACALTHIATWWFRTLLRGCGRSGGREAPAAVRAARGASRRPSARARRANPLSPPRRPPLAPCRGGGGAAGQRAALPHPLRVVARAGARKVRQNHLLQPGKHTAGSPDGLLLLPWQSPPVPPPPAGGARPARGAPAAGPGLGYSPPARGAREDGSGRRRPPRACGGILYLSMAGHQPGQAQPGESPGKQ
jgi:hypothetical protein